MTAGPPSLDLGFGRPAGAAFVALLAPLMNDLTRQYAQVLADPTAEAVHAMRKALRRLRALLALFGHEFDASSAAWIDNELKWMTRQLGPVRDIDVLMARIEGKQAYSPETRDADVAEGSLSQSRVVAVERALTSLRTARAALLVGGLPSWIAQCGDVLAACATLDYCVVSTLQQQEARIQAAGRRLKTQGRVQRHHLRSAIKQLRYALEAFPALAVGHQAYVAALTDLHAVLGDMNDDAAGDHLLRRMAAQAGSRARIEHRPQTRTAQWETLLEAWRRLRAAQPEFAAALRSIT